MESDLHKLRIIRRPEVEQLTGLSRATLYRLIAQGLFPGPVRIAHNAVGWREGEIREWLASREPALIPGVAPTVEHPEREGAAR